MKSFIAVVFTAALLAAIPAAAHEAIGPNGGRVVDAGNYHVELVVGVGQVNVFITDGDDKPLATAGLRGTAILLASGKALRIPLAPDLTPALAGKTDVNLPADVKGVVQITGPDGKTVQGQYK